MDIDPLSYGQYNSFHPPFHSQPNITNSHPNLTNTPANLTNTPANIMNTQANLTNTSANIMNTQANLTNTPANIMNTQANIMNTPANLTNTPANIMNTQANLSNAQPNIHQAQPNTTNTQVSHLTPIPYPYYQPQLPYNQIPNQIAPTQPIQNSFNQYPNMPEEVTNDITEPIPEEEDIKPDISKIKLKKPKRLKGKTSSYWNKKITDKDFKFYGCDVCNIAFQDLTELDSHVTIHSNRVTSYDIRLQNQKKRKRLKKEKKKKKKEAKVKDEKNEFDLDIKPEDGYIGTEKVGDVKADICQSDKSNCDVKQDKKDLKTDGNRTEKDLVKDKDATSQKDAVYKCFACNKKFALSYYLKIHVRSHTDEKPYICNYCGQTFITASKLGRHNKRIHLSVRHQCRICYKFYHRFEVLTKHFDQKHADQKLEGEPYDYNAILPYLTELEDQFKEEEDTKKPKSEDIWGDALLEPLRAEPLGAEGTKDAEPRVENEVPAIEHLKVSVPKLEKEEKDVTNTYKIEEIEVKCELEETDEQDGISGSELIDEVYEPPSSDDEEAPKSLKAEREEAVKVEGGAEAVKEERSLSDDEEEYFPPGGWARSPPPVSPPRAASPPPKRKGGPGICELCNRTFSSRSYLKVHLRTHTGEKPFACYICHRGFITANKMHRHVLTHDETWVGENCIKPETPDIKAETEEDDNSEKKDKKPSKAEKAKNKILKKLNQKIDPKLKGNRSWQHSCDYCDKKFLHFETLQVHKKSHAGEELILKCKYCLVPQVDQVSKETHEQTHAGQKKPYLCTLCGRNYKNSAAMIYHRRNHKADSEKPFICDICSKRFDSHAKLARHIPTHSTEKFVYRYECPVCANMFHTRWHVQMHLKSHQKEGLILEENRNAVLAMVLQNARKIPLGPPAENRGALTVPPIPAGDERSRICNICGQVFQHFYYLEEHLKTHGNKIAVTDLEEEEEKKYTCQVCSKSFKLHYYLKLHSFTHTKEKPFICQQCGKGFITKGKLKRHLETHQGLKKYQCHICCKFFTRPSYMRIHIRTIHGTQDYNFRDYGIGVPVGIGVSGGLGVPLGQITDINM